MFATTFTAMAVIFSLSQQVPAALQAFQVEPAPALIPSEDELVDPATTRPEPIQAVKPEDVAAAGLADATPNRRPPVDISRVVPPADKRLTASETSAQTDVTPPVLPVQSVPEVQETVPVNSTQILDGQDAERALAQAKSALVAARRASGRFDQYNADGTLSKGTFALSRPGKMRFDYDDPTPILIVSDGTTVAIEDSELETVDRVPLSTTPLGLLLDDELEFGRDVDVLRVAQNAEKVGITVRDATGEVEGELTMMFDRASFDLLGWVTLDANLQTTTVELSDVTTNGRVDPRLFRLDEAEDEEDER